MTEFKVGDKVNVTSSCLGPFYGTVVEAEDCSAGLDYQVCIEGGEAFLTHPNELWWVYRKHVEAYTQPKRDFKLGDKVRVTGLIEGCHHLGDVDLLGVVIELDPDDREGLTVRVRVPHKEGGTWRAWVSEEQCDHAD